MVFEKVMEAFTFSYVCAENNFPFVQSSACEFWKVRLQRISSNCELALPIHDPIGTPPEPTMKSIFLRAYKIFLHSNLELSEYEDIFKGHSHLLENFLFERSERLQYFFTSYELLTIVAKLTDTLPESLPEILVNNNFNMNVLRLHTRKHTGKGWFISFFLGGQKHEIEMPESEHRTKTITAKMLFEYLEKTNSNILSKEVLTRINTEFRK